MNVLSNHPQWPAPGTVISVPAYLFLRHKGIVSDHWHGGKPMVISNSARAGGVAEEPWDVFTGGLAWKSEGYPGTLTPFEVLRRARSAFDTKYKLFNWNCENFIAYCHGLPPASPQVAFILLIALAGIVLVAARS